MNAPSHDLAEYLETSVAATGLIFGTDLFISREPSSPDAVVTLFDTVGAAPQAGFKYDYPSIQARIRSPRQDFQTGYITAESIKDALHELTNVTINSTRYIGIWAEGDIHQLGWDDNDRPIFTINFRIHRTT